MFWPFKSNIVALMTGPRNNVIVSKIWYILVLPVSSSHQGQSERVNDGLTHIDKGTFSAMQLYQNVGLCHSIRTKH